MTINKKILTVLAVFAIIIIFVFNNFKENNNYNQISLNEITVSNTKEEKIETIEKIKVHITGEVNNPGLIELDAESRIADAIELAGGLTLEADTSKTNLAYILSDGEKIYIPNFNDEDSQFTETTNSKININTASVSELKGIPGVGEATANSIFEYRSKNGKFSSIEDIKNVSGIGESKFEKMKDYITVK